MPAEAAAAGWRLAPLLFADLHGWADDDHAAAFTAFRRSAELMAAKLPKARAMPVDPVVLAAAGAAALAVPESDSLTARRFFEEWFVPLEVVPATGRGFFTGYYEPEVEGSLRRTARFAVPLYRRPADLVDVDDGNRPVGWDADIRFARATPSGLAEYPDRGAIETGALAGQGLELVWLESAIDAFFIHIQGSTRVTLLGGEVMRLTFAAKSGQPYTPIGRVLVERGALPRDAVTMATIREWLAIHPTEAPGVMAADRSFIFFKEAPVEDPALGPVAAGGVALTPGRSLAVDRTLHTFGCPVFIETALPDGKPLRRLMMAQDTGSAIIGPARGDIFFGLGEAAGELAGAMQAPGRFVLLMPRTAP